MRSLTQDGPRFGSYPVTNVLSPGDVINVPRGGTPYVSQDPELAKLFIEGESRCRRGLPMSSSSCDLSFGIISVDASDSDEEEEPSSDKSDTTLFFRFLFLSSCWLRLSWPGCGSCPLSSLLPRALCHSHALDYQHHNVWISASATHSSISRRITLQPSDPR